MLALPSVNFIFTALPPTHTHTHAVRNELQGKHFLFNLFSNLFGATDKTSIIIVIVFQFENKNSRENCEKEQIIRVKNKKCK